MPIGKGTCRFGETLILNIHIDWWRAAKYCNHINHFFVFKPSFEPKIRPSSDQVQGIRHIIGTTFSNRWRRWFYEVYRQPRGPGIVAVLSLEVHSVVLYSSRWSVINRQTDGQESHSIPIVFAW